MKEPYLYTLLDDIRSCNYQELEQMQIIEDITSFKPAKLKALIDDIEYYIFIEKEEQEAKYSDEQIEEAIIKLKAAGKPIPKKKFLAIPALNIEGFELLDLEKLLFPFEFYCIYSFKALVISYLSEADKQTSDQVPLIWWKRSKEKLQAILNELQGKGYIDSISLANFMDADRKPFSTNAASPLWWKKSGRLLRYLMDELARLNYIDRESPVNKHIKEHFIDKQQKPFTDSIKQNSSGAGNNKSGKPRGHEEIDDLIISLQDDLD